jgi:hypothetical protein
MVDNMIDEC